MTTDKVESLLLFIKTQLLCSPSHRRLKCFTDASSGAFIIVFVASERCSVGEIERADEERDG
jgi:hypothetical protein